MAIFLVPTILKISQNHWVWKGTSRGHLVKPPCSNWARARIFHFKRKGWFYFIIHPPEAFPPHLRFHTIACILERSIQKHCCIMVLYKPQRCFQDWHFCVTVQDKYLDFALYFGGKWSSKPLHMQVILHFTEAHINIQITVLYLLFFWLLTPIKRIEFIWAMFVGYRFFLCWNF